MLPRRRGDVPDAGRELALPALMGGVPGTVAGPPPLVLPVVLRSSTSTSPLTASSSSSSTGRTERRRACSVRTHADAAGGMLLWVVMVRYGRATMLLTVEGGREGGREFLLCNRA